MSVRSRLGHRLEFRARSKTGAAIRKLLGPSPKMARRLLGTAAKKTCRSISSRWVTGCARGPARRRPSTACPRQPCHVDESLVSGEPVPVGSPPATASSVLHVRSGHQILLTYLLQLPEQLVHFPDFLRLRQEDVDR